MSKKRATVGQSSLELSAKGYDKLSPVDLQRAIHQGEDSKDSWENQICIAADEGKKKYSGDFYVVVLFRRERTMANVVRQVFFSRQSCPTPEYDQTVFKFRRSSDDMEFLWTIPDPGTCAHLLHNRAFVPLEEQVLVQFVEDFSTGQLDIKARKLNRELLSLS